MTDSSRRDFSRSISRASSTCRCTTPSSRPSTIAASGATRESIPSIAQPTADVRQHPTGGAALIGGTGGIGMPIDAKVDHRADVDLCAWQRSRSACSGSCGFSPRRTTSAGCSSTIGSAITPGALRMSDVGLMGGATTPKPAIVVNFKSFPLDPKNPHMSGIIVGGTRQHGQGDHGSLSRANTFNNMAAIGPDFKKRFVSQSPVSNADVQPTLGARHEDEDSEPRRAARTRHHRSAGRRAARPRDLRQASCARARPRTGIRPC